MKRAHVTAWLSSALRGRRVREGTRVVGIDAGSAFLKGLALDHSDREPRVTALHLGPAVRPGSASAGVRRLASATASGARIVASVGGPDVLVEAVAADAARSGDPLTHLRHRSPVRAGPDAAPVPTEVAMAVHDPGSAGASGTVVAAARRSVVDARRALLREGGLDPDVIDLDGVAILNAFIHSHPTALDGSLVLIDIGASRTLLDVLDRGRLLLHREIAWGVGAGGPEAAPQSPDPGEVIDALDRAAAVVRARGLAEQIGRLWVCGGGAVDTALVAQLAEATRIESHRVDPFAHVSFAPDAWAGGPLDEVAPLFTLALGLALRHS